MPATHRTASWADDERGWQHRCLCCPVPPVRSPRTPTACADIFIRDRVNHTTRKMQVRHPEQWRRSWLACNDAGWSLHRVLLLSWELVPGDTNDETDIFVYDSGDSPDDRDDLLVNFGPQGLWERLTTAHGRRSEAARA